MLKVLSIGNSFSSDAQRYLHKVAAAEGVDMKCVNLYIGGCSLYRHYINMLEDKADYLLEFNGESTGFYVSMKQALISDSWDYITLQQVSSSSFKFDTYLPYLPKLAEYVRLYSPKTKILIHQTWAYDAISPRYEALKLGTPKNMIDGIVCACRAAEKEISADGIIPCGVAMMKAYEDGMTMHRDGHHASLGIGRYLLALTWYKALTGKRAVCDFADFDVEVSPEDAAKMRSIVE